MKAEWLNNKKRYIGNFSDEEEAAREYDKIAIQFHGPKAKTNFQYNEDEIKSILAAPKCKKLSYLFWWFLILYIRHPIRYNFNYIWVDIYFLIILVSIKFIF